MFSWATFLSYAIITAITPGPNCLMAMNCAARVGMKRAMPFELGILAGFSVAALLCTAFCSLLQTALPAIELPMKIIGAAYMLFLAYHTLRSSSEVQQKDSPKGYGFWSGAFLQFLNPKLYLYCIVSMEAYILPYFHGQWAALVGFSLLLAGLGFVCTLLWAAFGSTFKLLFSKYAKATSIVMALLLAYCAVSLFL